MDTLTSLRVFCRVAEYRNFSVAADRLDMSPSMASKHVRHLEDRVGSRLLERTSRHVRTTEAGALYLSQARQTLEALDEAEAALGNACLQPQGTLRISAPIWFANARFSGMIAEFASLYPEVRFDVDLSGRHVNLVEEGFDVTFRVATPDSLDPNLIVRPLVDMPLQLVGAPGYLDRCGRPAALSELSGCDLLLDAEARSAGVVAFDTPAGRETIRFNVPLQCGNETLLHLLALEGLGLAILPEIMIEEDVGARCLEKVLPGVAQVSAKLYAVYPSRRFLSAKVRTFIDFFIHKSRLILSDLQN